MKKCGSGYKRNERFTLAELKEEAKRRGIRGYSTMNMDALCDVLYGAPITPKAVIAKNCGSQYKRGERYTLVELKSMAKTRGIPKYSTMNMDELCKQLNLTKPTSGVVISEPVQYEQADINNIVFRKGYGLLSHQKQVLKWMGERMKVRHNNGLKGGILQLDMGLGKTLISLYWILLSRRAYKSPFLVVCDKSLIDNWVNEATKFFGDRIKYFVFYGKLDKVHRSDYMDADFVITTYNTVKIISEPYHKYIKDGAVVKNANFSDKPRDGPAGLIHTRWAGIFADEAQAFSNPTTKAFVSMMRLSSNECWCLTGTPIRNSDKDMYSLMRFCGLNTMTNPKYWDIVYYRSHQLYNYVKSMDYEQANIKLPDIIEDTIIVDMDPAQRNFYNYYEDLFREFAWLYAKRAKEEYILERQRLGRPLTRYEMGGVQVNFSLILALFTRMRQISIIPRIAWLNSKDTENVINDNTVRRLSNDMKKWISNPNSSAYAHSAKLKKATKIIGDILTKTDEKILVFSSFRQVLELYQKMLVRVFPNTGIAMLNGEQSVSERTRNINFFKEGSARIFLITFKTGSQGLTLTEANHVIPLDPWWTPTVYAQAVARAHRIGQTRNVFVYNILTKDSIETRIMKICMKKQAVIKQFLGEEGEDVSLKLDFKQIVDIMTGAE